MFRSSTSATVLLLVIGINSTACDRPTSDDTSAPPELITDSGGASGGSCEGEPPVVDEIWCVNSGIKPHYETGVDTVTMQVWTAVSDLDGDLTSYALQIFYDEEVDGAVDTSITNFNPVYGTLDNPECSATSVELGLTLYLTGDSPDYDTLYDWGVVVTDAYGLTSETGVTECWTPTSDGADGGVEASDTGR